MAPSTSIVGQLSSSDTPATRCSTGRRARWSSSSSASKVAITSVSGLRGDWRQAAYNATKHAVTGFVRSLALDWGERGVRVNAVAPAFTLTEMTAGLASTPQQLAPFVDRIALGRPGLPEDVAPAVLFLASEDAAYVTGAVLTVDGGTSASTGQPHVLAAEG